MKRALMFLSRMLEDGKSVQADIEKAVRAAADRKQLDKYTTGKEYRDKALQQQHTSLRAWHSNAVHFVAEMGKVVPGVEFVTVSPHPAVDETMTYRGVATLLKYDDEMQKALAELG